MKMRVTATAAILALAGAAHADFFQTVSDGEFVETAVDGTSRTIEFETSIFDQIGPYGFVTADGEFTQTFVGPIMDELTGEVVLTGPDAGDTVVASYEGVFFPGDNGDATFAGVWETTETTGIYAGLFGEGQFSGSYLFEEDEAGQFILIIQGELIPAPGAAALLGLGGLVAMRRRR